MRISVENVAARFDELVEMTERGEDVVLTRGDKAVILRPVETAPERAVQSPEERRRIIDEIIAKAKERDLHTEVSAARSQDFLYGEDGLPG